ncbi:MAG: hypothetical protein D6767_01535 [Candidatus Hydrogenedentota bacterium]|nr:MAG: hypothetical protein D6767_01535 [Candidatus Hydrogenedentota bacterium]
MVKWVFVSVLFLLSFSCVSSDVKLYHGQKCRKPVQKTKWLYELSDEYTAYGEIIVQAGSGIPFAKIKADILQKAAACGADAVVMKKTRYIESRWNVGSGRDTTGHIEENYRRIRVLMLERK